jgi:hypothetical protein
MDLNDHLKKQGMYSIVLTVRSDHADILTIGIPLFLPVSSFT